MSPGHAAFLTNPQNGSWFTTANPSTTRSTLDVLEPDVPDTGTPKRPAANALLGEGGHPEHPSALPLRERVRERRSPRGHGFQKPGGAAPCVFTLQTHVIRGAEQRRVQTPVRHSPYWELCAGSFSLPVTLVGNVHQTDLVHPETVTV